MVLDYGTDQGELTRVAGHFELAINGFFEASGSMALAMYSGTAAIGTAATAVAVDWMTLGGTDLAGFVGVPGIGFEVSQTEFGLGIASEKTGAQRVWTALNANVGAAGLNGVDGLTIEGDDLAVAMNIAASDSTFLNLSGSHQLTVATGVTTELVLDLDPARGAVVELSGTFTIDAFQFAQFSGSLAVTKELGSVVLADGETLDTHNLLIGGDNLRAFVGVNGGQANQTGLEVSGLSFGLALFASRADDTRTWTSLQGTASSAGLVGVSDLSVLGSDILLEINQAGRDGDAVVDFASGKTDLSVATGGDPVAMSMLGIYGDLLRIGGSFALSAFGFVRASGSLAMERRSAKFLLNDGDDDTAPTEIDAQILTIGGTDLDLFVGTSDLGLALNDADFGVLLATETGGAERQFVTINADIGDLGLVGFDGLTARAEDASLTLNRGVGDVVLDHSDRQFEVLASGAGATVTLDADGDRGELAEVAGTIELDLFGLAQVSGSIAASRSLQTVKDAGGTDITAEVITLGGTGLSGFVGVGGNTDERIGLALEDAELALALVDEQGGANRQWVTAESAVGSLGFVGIDGFTATASNFEVTVNKAQGNYDALDHGISGLTVATGPDSERALSASGDLLSAAGTLELDVFGLLQVNGDFAIEQRFQDVTLSDDSEIEQARLITLGGTNINGFVGANGGQADQVGAQITGLTFGLALIEETEAGQRTFTSVQATADSAGMVGLGDITARIDNLLVNVNQGVYVDAIPEITTRVNAQYALAVASDWAGQLALGYEGQTATVEVASATSSVQLRDLLTAQIESLVGSGNVLVSGNRAEGFVVEFIGALEGQDVALSLASTAQTASATVVEDTAADPGADEEKRLRLQFDQITPDPVDATVVDLSSRNAIDEVQRLQFEAFPVAGPVVSVERLTSSQAAAMK